MNGVQLRQLNLEKLNIFGYLKTLVKYLEGEVAQGRHGDIPAEALFDAQCVISNIDRLGMVPPLLVYDEPNPGDVEKPIGGITR